MKLRKAKRTVKARGRRKPGSTGNRYTDAEIARALYESGGLILRAAQSLGCKRDTISSRVAKNPELQELQAAAREETGDIAEDTLRKAIELENTLMSDALIRVRNGQILVEIPKLSATFFVNKTLNRGRGYNTSTEVTGPGGRPLLPGGFVVLRPEEESASFEEWRAEFMPVEIPAEASSPEGPAKH